MGSSTGLGPSDLDTSQPGVRQIQAWIRNRVNLAVQLQDGTALTGTPRWIDGDFIALQPEFSEELVLISRSAIALLRALV